MGIFSFSNAKKVEETVEIRSLRLLIRYLEETIKIIDVLIYEIANLPDNEKIIDFKKKVAGTIVEINFNLLKIKNTKSIIMNFRSGSTKTKREVNESFEGFQFIVHPVESKKVLLNLLNNQDEKLDYVLERLKVSLQRVLNEESDSNLNSNSKKAA